MRDLVSGSTMKQLDDNTSTYFHVPSVVLMEQAATGFVQELLTLGEFQHILILCGNGNNGADGVAVARLLNQCQIHTVLCPLIKQGGSELYQLQMQIYDTYAYEKS